MGEPEGKMEDRKSYHKLPGSQYVNLMAHQPYLLLNDSPLRLTEKGHTGVADAGPHELPAKSATEGLSCVAYPCGETAFDKLTRSQILPRKLLDSVRPLAHQPYLLLNNNSLRLTMKGRTGVAAAGPQDIAEKGETEGKTENINLSVLFPQLASIFRDEKLYRRLLLASDSQAQILLDGFQQ
ncbi:hypothetical protein DXG01_000533, partial [Tephrocybe rancida]